MGTAALPSISPVSEAVKETVPSRPIILRVEIIVYWQTLPTPTKKLNQIDEVNQKIRPNDTTEIRLIQ